MRFSRLCILSTTAILAGAAPALAQSTLKLGPNTGHPNLAVNVTGTAFANSEAVDVYVDTTDTLLLVSSATGTLSGSVTIPASAQPGTHYVTAIGRRSGDAAQTAFTVTTPWTEQAFGAAHLGLNQYENTIGVNNVGTIGTLWDANVDSVGAAPVIVGGRVIVATASNVQALSAATGALQWTALSGQVFYASPAVANGNVYIGTSSGAFAALSAATGKQLWSVTLGSVVYSSATVSGGVVYVGCADQKVYALKASTGAVLWTYTTGGLIDGSAAVVNGVVYIGSNDDKIYALNAATGALLWSYATGGAVESSPAVSNGVVYVGSDDDNIYAIRAKGPGVGTKLWSYNAGSAVFGSPAVANDTVYIGAESGNMYALNGQTGAPQWQVATGSITGSAAVANGVVYFTARDGSFYAVAAGNGGVLATAQTGYNFLGNPVISDGVIYLNTYQGDAYAFSLGTGTDPAHAPPQRPDPKNLRPDYTLRVTRAGR